MDLPCLAKCYLCCSIFVAKAQLDRPVLVKRAIVETDVFLQRLGDKRLFVEGRLCFAGHFQDFLFLARERSGDTYHHWVVL